MIHRPCSVLLALLVCCRAGAAWAGDDRSGDPAIEDARKHYRRGVEFYNDQSYGAALAEFRRAYEIAPNVNVLYNIGQLQFRLQDYAGALATLQKYLSDGGTTLAPDRRSAVERDVERLRDRVAYLEVQSSVDGAEVLVGEALAGRTPLASPVVTNIGHAHISLRQSGREIAARDVDLAAGDHTQVVLETEPEPATPPLPAPAAVPAPPPTPEPTPAATSVSPSPAVAPPAPLAEAPGHRATPRWIATTTWAGAAALATGATVTGVLALAAAGDLSKDRSRDAVSRADLDATQGRVKTLALTTDILGAAAIVTAGVALYITIDSRRRTDAAALSLRFTPASVSVIGFF